MKKVVILAEEQEKVLRGLIQMNKEIIMDSEDLSSEEDIKNELKDMELLESALDQGREYDDEGFVCLDQDCSEQGYIVLLMCPLPTGETFNVKVTLEQLEETILTGALTEVKRADLFTVYYIAPKEALDMLCNYWENWSEPEEEHGSFWGLNGSELWRDYNRYKSDVWLEDHRVASVFEYIHEFEHSDGWLNPVSKRYVIENYWENLGR